MGYNEVGKLIDRVLEDQSIRDLLRKDPKQAAEKCGIMLTTGELETIKKMDWNLTDVELKSRISKI